MESIVENLIHAAYILAVLSVIIAITVVYEHFYWHKHNLKKSYTLYEFIANSALGFLYKISDGVAVALYVFFLYDGIASYGLQLSLLDAWWSFPLIYIIVDLGFYVTHYAMHKVRWFWASHVTHHSGTRYNFSTAMRQNFTVIFNGAVLIWWLPIALLGFDKNLVLAAMEINLLYQYLLHTELPTPRLNKLGGVLNTPSHHRVHHGCNSAQIDKNFAGTFIIWDKLFGTFRAQEDAGELIYGITRRQPTGYNPITLLFHEWRDMFSDLWKTKDLRVLLKPPGWIDTRPKTKIKPQPQPQPLETDAIK